MVIAGGVKVYMFVHKIYDFDTLCAWKICADFGPSISFRCWDIWVLIFNTLGFQQDFSILIPIKKYRADDFSQMLGGEYEWI